VGWICLIIEVFKGLLSVGVIVVQDNASSYSSQSCEGMQWGSVWEEKRTQRDVG
jgi:hypothetical protein